MIQAFRDTWELGIHSYLTHLRDRLLLAKELLKESGSVFVQISEIHKGDDGADPNTHPTVDFWRVNRKTGQWKVGWPAPGEGSISYELYRSIRKDDLSFEWIGNEDPYGVVVIWDQNNKIQPKLIVFGSGDQIYAYDAHYLKDGLGMGPYLGLAYDQLADRAGKPQPRPFADILGNGLPDLVIDEHMTGGTAGVGRHMLTVISMGGTNVVETPAVLCNGATIYFKDFDGDGVMEIVNTDWEQGFKFDETGMPICSLVWKFSKKAGRYQQTGKDLPAPPDTWPAYRDK